MLMLALSMCVAFVALVTICLGCWWDLITSEM